jgi:cytochrome c oxidase subunit III
VQAAASVKRVGNLQTPLVFGVMLFLISETFLFGSLFWTYYYLRSQSVTWPPAGALPGLTLPVLNTLLLLSSSVVMQWAVAGIRAGKIKRLSIGLGAVCSLGVAFLGVTAWDWVHQGFRPWTNAYGSIFYTLTGFHALHVLMGVVLLAILLSLSMRHRFSSGRFLSVEAGSLYWHFVDLVWLFVFTTVFIVR